MQSLVIKSFEELVYQPLLTTNRTHRESLSKFISVNVKNAIACFPLNRARIWLTIPLMSLNFSLTTLVRTALDGYLRPEFHTFMCSSE